MSKVSRKSKLADDEMSNPDWNRSVKDEDRETPIE
jgi:hypothetical protein